MFLISTSQGAAPEVGWSDSETVIQEGPPDEGSEGRSAGRCPTAEILR